MISPSQCGSSSQPTADRPLLLALALVDAGTWGRIYPEDWLTPLGISVLSQWVQPLQIRTGCNPDGTEQWEERSSPLLSLNGAGEPSGTSLRWGKFISLCILITLINVVPKKGIWSSFLPGTRQTHKTLLIKQTAYVGGRAWKLWDVLKRSNCKNCLFVGMDFHLSSFTSDSYQQNQDFLLSKQSCLWTKKSFANSFTCMPVFMLSESYCSTGISTALLFPWLGLVQTQPPVQAPQATSPSWLPTAFKTDNEDNEFWNSPFSCCDPLPADSSLQDIPWKFSLDQQCKFILWPVPSKTNIKVVLRLLDSGFFVGSRSGLCPSGQHPTLFQQVFIFKTAPYVLIPHVRAHSTCQDFLLTKIVFWWASEQKFELQRSSNQVSVMSEAQKSTIQDSGPIAV